MSGIDEVKGIEEVVGPGIPINSDEIDTDVVIPARYLRCVTFDGLGEKVFHDVRLDEKGNPTDHSFNDPRYQGAVILFAGKQFGTGSSREHAPQALYRWGIRAIVAESYGPIFQPTANIIGMPTVTYDNDTRQMIMGNLNEHPETKYYLDLRLMELRFNIGGKPYTHSINMEENARKSLIEGIYDPLPLLQANEEMVIQRGKELPQIINQS